MSTEALPGTYNRLPSATNDIHWQILSLEYWDCWKVLFSSLLLYCRSKVSS